MFTDESCVIIDEYINIVEINALALKYFFNEGFASGVKGKLKIHNNDIHSTLMHKVTALVKSTNVSDDVLFFKNKHTLYFASLKKVSKNISRPILYTPCMIMIVIYPINKSFNKIDVNLIADLFKLTMSEAKLCGEISKGSSLKEAGYCCNISYEHARQRIKVIFQKTQTSNQVELRILLNSLSRFT